MNSRRKGNRRTLRESLKTILRYRRDDNIDQSTIGSGILKRQDPSLALLSSVSSFSLLPDFESSRFDIDQFSVSIPEFNSATPITIRADDLSGRSLLPKTSLSQFHDDVRESYLYQSQLHQLAQACSVPSIYGIGASQQGSFASISTLTRSTSTLKLKRSTQTLRSKPTLTPLIVPSQKSRAIIPEIVSSQDNRQCRTPRRTRGSIQELQPTIRVHPPEESESTVHNWKEEPQNSGIDHFASFCVLDTWLPGCPVTATSADLRYIFDIGEPFCLNSQNLDGVSMDTVTGLDADGNAVTHLVLYSPLVNPNSGRSRFVLASLVDVTPFIRDAATFPELDTVEEESVIEEELQTPPKGPETRIASYKHSAESLLGGCYLPDSGVITPPQKITNDIWLDIATEESKRSRGSQSTSGTVSPQSGSNISYITPSIDDMLDNFIADLQDLYSDFFLLGKSPLDENSYEICNVSPRVFADRGYVDGHLTHTPRQEKARLEEHLTHETRFQIGVRWGNAGKFKQLYCIPLFGRNSITWVGFLVEAHQCQQLPLWVTNNEIRHHSQQR